jgi:hypothetical protein
VSPEETDLEEPNRPAEYRIPPAVAVSATTPKLPTAPTIAFNAQPVIVPVPITENDTADDVAFEPPDAALNEGVPRAATTPTPSSVKPACVAYVSPTTGVPDVINYIREFTAVAGPAIP